MRILIGLHHVTLGGDTTNALELADRLRRRGHEASLLALVTPGIPRSQLPLLTLAEERGVPVLTFRTPTSVTDRVRLVVRLARLVREQHYDVVHAFGHQDTYYAFLGTYGLAGVPLVVNDYAMSMTRGLPRRVPLVVGTREMLEAGRSSRRGPTYLVEPPIDLEANRPGAVDAMAFRRRHGIRDDDVLLVAVSRLARAMKAEGLHGSIEAVRLLADQRVRLVLVGDGSEGPALEDRAEAVNEQLGSEAVVLAGQLVDPRPAYAAADVVLGMGHSGLRGMAFGKPLVILGERGFALPLTPEAVEHLDYHGVYGVGDGGDIGARIAEALRPLVDDKRLREERGRLALDVVQRFGLDVAAERLEQVYRQAMARRSVVDWARDLAGLAQTYLPAKARRATVGAPS